MRSGLPTPSPATERALLFTDLVDSTLLVQRLGDARAAELWAVHDRQARDLLAAHRGREIDRSDGFFLLFDATADAARYALAYHRALDALGLVARVGLHVGRVTLRENSAADIARGAKPVEVEGLAKPFAARVMALARGGQTLLSRPAHAALDVLPGGAEIECHGHYRLKGVDAPAEVFELGRRGHAAFTPPPDTDKAYRVVAAGDLWRPVREVRHNLPGERDAFIGRSAELRALAQRLDAGSRLVTVLGPGGTGKTRFVRRYAWSWLGDWPGGVYFCDLSEARDREGVLGAVALGLGMPLGKGDAVLRLGHAIAGRGRCLVILDNVEQVLGPAAAVLGPWLDRSTEACFVVTSRERLQLPGEGLLALDPLPVASEAVELFVARACAHKPDFALNDSNRSAVERIVQLLDGLPLAIELAAARVRVFSPAQLVERMHDRFQILAGARGAAARQATLRAAIDWSWDLLTPWEQAALAQCSVFEGGFTMEAAEAVVDLAAWADAPPAMDAVQALVDKSLLRTWVPAGQARYDIEEPCFGMYLSIREYAAGKLAAAGIGAERAAGQRHARYFAGFGSEAALDALYRHGGVRRRRALALELDNLVAACRRATVHGPGETAVAAFRAAWEVLELQGPFALGTALGTSLLALDGIDASVRAAAHWTCALAAWRSGRIDAAQALLERSLSLALEAQDRRREGCVLFSLGNLQIEQGNADATQVHYDAALAIVRETGQRRLEGTLLGNLGNLHGEQSRLEQSHGYFQQALVVHREVGNRSGEGNLLGNLGNLHCDRGHMDEARVCYEEALAIAREVGNRSNEGIVLGNLGSLECEQGQADAGRAHYEAALAIHREVGNRQVEGIVLGNVGVEYQALGRLDEARAHLQAALEIHREVNNRRDEGFVLGRLGQLHSEQGELHEAYAQLEAALAIHREVGDRRREGSALASLGELLALQGHAHEARDALDAGEVLLREVSDPLELARLLCIRGRLQAGAGDASAARSALAEARALAASAGAAEASAVGREIAKLGGALS